MDACEVQLTNGGSSFQELVDDMAKDSYWILLPALLPRSRP